jgi:hypothetical protein
MEWILRVQIGARMNASRPEAKVKDSTSVRATGLPRWLPTPVFGLALVGALALIISQFAPLLRVVTVARHPVLVRTVQTGPHHGWALIPVAALALLVAALARRPDGRTAPAALALLGLVSLGVALLVDLRGVHATGIVGSPATGLQTAQAHAGVGLYLETLGAALLLLAAGVGTVLSSDTRPSVSGDRSGSSGPNARQPRRNTPPTDPGFN